MFQQSVLGKGLVVEDSYKQLYYIENANSYTRTMNLQAIETISYQSFQTLTVAQKKARLNLRHMRLFAVILIFIYSRV